MADKELADYVKKTREKGFDLEQIKAKLGEAGYDEKDIHDVLIEVASAKEEKGSNVKVFLLIFLIAAGVMLTSAMIFRLVSNAHSFESETDKVSAAVVMDMNMCANMEDNNEKDLCFYTIAKENTDEHFCHRVENKELKDFCLSALTGTQINCSKIIDEELRRECESS